MPNKEPQVQQEQHPNREKLPHPVYYVTSDKDDTVLIGMEVERRDNMMRWFDTIKERMMGIEEIVDHRPDHFVFRRTEREGGQTYSFVPMDLDTYNAHVKSQLINGKDFTDTDAMVKAFEEARDNEW